MDINCINEFYQIICSALGEYIRLLLMVDSQPFINAERARFRVEWMPWDQCRWMEQCKIYVLDDNYFLQVTIGIVHTMWNGNERWILYLFSFYQKAINNHQISTHRIVWFLSSQINAGQESAYWVWLVKNAVLIVSWHHMMVGSTSFCHLFR